MVNWLPDGNMLMEKPVKDSRTDRDHRSRTEKTHQDDEEQQVGTEAIITKGYCQTGMLLTG
ncbi:hypothetical protein C9J03_17910 [Photobacterium gaetbulicola]|uniref:Uncharacterized protein n=1 Tax=Photobacterium gaetbulicola TaxID=1295392 RepID=A0A0B9FZS0_9GAMM|nr:MULTISPECIES: hypothetical protein [Photobacterium]KHT61779.1 hypothetical protein RJ45_20925 [Photobacterium gaetbulicola]PSU05069.1 hypothetical protein C9J03_17910 [Photobacterium gaetbulicola]WEM42202.1 hypothetical protein PTW35_17075 [Photobacterium sp. DA100]